jgi:hypothetical protein
MLSISEDLRFRKGANKVMTRGSLSTVAKLYKEKSARSEEEEANVRLRSRLSL